MTPNHSRTLPNTIAPTTVVLNACKIIGIITFIGLTSMGLTACSSGGGNNNSSATGRGDNVFITVAPAALSYETFKSNNGVNKSQQKTLRVEFEGEGVLVGFAPNVAQPSWLSFPDTLIDAPSKSFDLTISANAQFMRPGRYETSLRLLTGLLDGSDGALIDIPIQFVIEPTPAIYDGAIRFNHDTITTALPSSQAIQLDLGPLASGTVNASLRNGNNEMSNWLSLNSENQELLLAVTASRPAGTYQGDVFIRYEYNGGTAEKAIPVTLEVAALAPKLHYAVPPMVYVNESNEFIIRGVGFLSDTIQAVSLNAIPAASFNVISNSEIRAQFTGIDSIGEYTINVATTNASLTVPTNILVKQKQPAVAGLVEFPTGVVDFKFDAKRDAVVVATENTLYRVKLINSNWEVVTQRSLAASAIALTPDAEHIAYADETAIYLLDASTLATSATYPLPYINISSGDGAYRSVALKNMTNNGDIMLVLSDDTGTNISNSRLSVFQLPNQLLTITQNAAPSPVSATDTLKRKVFVAPGSRSFSGFYNASTQAFEPDSSLDITTVSSNRFAHSGNGQRFFMGNVSGSQIYDSTLSLLGSMPFDSSISNYTVEISQQGHQSYLIEPLTGLVHVFDITTPPYSKTGTLAFPSFFVYAPFPKTQTTPDDSLLLLGSRASNTQNSNYWLVMVPL